WYIGKAFVQWMQRHRHCMFLAETEDGEAVGFLIGRCDGDKARIGWIAVHQTHWGRGVGGMLLSAIEQCAIERGIKVVETGTPFARTFYEKYGYECVG
ncbi:MAG: GNAT family N-acetyltransferase, partial [Armatimonadetes bacterium]|nr:GNAT family N-acetyltransferase [Armatimonadota bacterium]